MVHAVAGFGAAALGAGFVLHPRITRFVAMLFGTVAISDALQHVYNAEKKLSKQRSAERGLLRSADRW